MRVKCTKTWNVFKKGEIYNATEDKSDGSWFVFVEGSKLLESGGEYGYYVHDHKDYFKVIEE